MAHALPQPPPPSPRPSRPSRGNVRPVCFVPAVPLSRAGFAGSCVRLRCMRPAVSPRSLPSGGKRPRRRTGGCGTPRPQPAMQFNPNGNGRPNDSDGKPFARLLSADWLVSLSRFLQSPSGQVLLWVGLVWLVVTGRIGIVFDSFLFLFAFVTIVPVLAVLAFRWWLSRQLVNGVCPSCGTSVVGIKGQSFPCNVCGNTVYGDPHGSFSVKDPTSATIDIDAKQVDD